MKIPTSGQAMLGAWRGLYMSVNLGLTYFILGIN